MADLLVIVPSRGRPQSVPRLVDAWEATGAYAYAGLAFAVDGDDPHHAAYVGQASDRSLMLTITRWLPMVHKLNRIAAGLAGDYFALGFAGDDHVPRSAGWAGRYVDELRRLRTGIVYGNDLVQGERLPTQWAMTSDIVRELGRMVPADVEHLYCDNAIADLGRAARCITYLSDVVVEHMHPIAGRVAWDDQYRRVNGRAQYDRDRAAYQQWRRHGLRADARRVRELRRR